jgi:hypothetical protein
LPSCSEADHKDLLGSDHLNWDNDLTYDDLVAQVRTGQEKVEKDLPSLADSIVVEEVVFEDIGAVLLILGSTVAIKGEVAITIALSGQGDVDEELVLLELMGSSDLHPEFFAHSDAARSLNELKLSDFDDVGHVD